jgi:hypothetical protein
MSWTPMSATKSTPTAVAPAAMRRWVRAQPEAQRKPVAAARPCQTPKATRPMTITTMRANPKGSAARVVRAPCWSACPPPRSAICSAITPMSRCTSP